MIQSKQGSSYYRYRHLLLDCQMCDIMYETSNQRDALMHVFEASVHVSVYSYIYISGRKHVIIISLLEKSCFWGKKCH